MLPTRSAAVVVALNWLPLWWSLHHGQARPRGIAIASDGQLAMSLRVTASSRALSRSISPSAGPWHRLPRTRRSWILDRPRRVRGMAASPTPQFWNRAIGAAQVTQRGGCRGSTGITLVGRTRTLYVLNGAPSGDDEITRDVEGPIAVDTPVSVDLHGVASGCRYN